MGNIHLLRCIKRISSNVCIIRNFMKKKTFSAHSTGQVLLMSVFKSCTECHPSCLAPDYLRIRFGSLSFNSWFKRSRSCHLRARVGFTRGRSCHLRARVEFTRGRSCHLRARVGFTRWPFKIVLLGSLLAATKGPRQHICTRDQDASNRRQPGSPV